MQTFQFCVISKIPVRVDILISTLFSEYTRTYIAKCIERHDILVNNAPVKKNTLLKHRDIVSFKKEIYSTEILAEDIELDIIYEDESLIVLNKDAGINVHPVPGIEGKKGTLVNALLYHTKGNLPVISGEERPGIVHRLDKDTSGSLLVAKNDTMMQYLTTIIKERNIKKYYLAVVAGVPEENIFTIHSHIGRDRYDRTKMTVKNPLNPKEAITHIEIIGNYIGKYGLLKIDLETGRTHQIRVHLASIGYPILGDAVYGDEIVNREARKQLGITRQMLHAESLSFNLYHKKVSFKAPLKDDMKIFFNTL
ncbi:RluA family pseudouridine synthase [Candidatus Gracilibacteria bacterium]|nr:RluA family pseudouridine synthase [Candidatus Gracilibacteria bacterium]